MELPNEVREESPLPLSTDKVIEELAGPPITIDDVLRNLQPPEPHLPRLERPLFSPRRLDGQAIDSYHRGNVHPRIGLAVESMKHHTTDEGWQIFAGLERMGCALAGYNLPIGSTDVKEVLELNPYEVIVQDKREWDVWPGDFREAKAKFTNVGALRDRPDILKLTILKDAHQRPLYHCESASEMGVHGWIVYYHPRIVQHLAPWSRSEDYLRVYHTLNSTLLPPHTPRDHSIIRKGTLFSGAISGAYPLRQRIHYWIEQKLLRRVDHLPHPGYNRNGCQTPTFLQKILPSYRVAICTASRFGYALRKIIEATACGCRVITDLPVDEVLPKIDGNLVRVSPKITVENLQALIDHLETSYDPSAQDHWAFLARTYYDYRVAGTRLALQIDRFRNQYPRAENP